MKACNVVQETLLAAVEAHVLNIDTSDLGANNTLSRAATRFVSSSLTWLFNRSVNQAHKYSLGVQQIQNVIRIRTSSTDFGSGWI